MVPWPAAPPKLIAARSEGAPPTHSPKMKRVLLIALTFCILRSSNRFTVCLSLLELVYSVIVDESNHFQMNFQE